MTPEKTEAICNVLRAGNTRTAAAGFAGISRNTLYEWMERNQTFRDAIEKAEHDAEVRYVAQIAKAATDGTWTAAAWWLERRRPDDWKKREETTIVGKDNGPVQVSGTFDFDGFSSVFREVATGRDAGPSAPDADGPDE